MRRQRWIAAAAVLGLTSTGLFHQASAITGCDSNSLCEELEAQVEATAPGIIPWDEIWALDDRISVESPATRSIELYTSKAVAKVQGLKDDRPIVVAAPGRDLAPPTIPTHDQASIITRRAP